MQHTAVDGADLRRIFEQHPSVFWELNLHVQQTVDLHPLVYVGTNGSILIVPSFGLLQDTCLPEVEEWKELFEGTLTLHNFHPLPHAFLFESTVCEMGLGDRSRFYFYDTVKGRKVPIELHLDPGGYYPFEEVPTMWVGYVHAFMPDSCWPVVPKFF